LIRSHLLLLAGLLCAGCATTGARPQHLDLDGNAALSRGEFSDAVADVSFANYDRNGDNFIDLDEWRAVEKGNANDGLFRLRDLSRNGRISRHEARLAAEKNGSLAGLFTTIDTNRNGGIDRTEARQYQAVLRAARR